MKDPLFSLVHKAEIVQKTAFFTLTCCCPIPFFPKIMKGAQNYPCISPILDRRHGFGGEGKMNALRQAEKLLGTMTPAEKAQLLQWVARDLGEAFAGIESRPGVCGGEPVRFNLIRHDRQAVTIEIFVSTFVPDALFYGESILFHRNP